MNAPLLPPFDTVAVSCGYYTWFAARLVMDYTTSHFTTQKLTKSTLAVKLSVSAIIYPRWTATDTDRLFSS